MTAEPLDLFIYFLEPLDLISNTNHNQLVWVTQVIGLRRSLSLHQDIL